MEYPLSGDGWRLRALPDTAWLRPDFADLLAPGAPGWIPAAVPGSVQHDLWRAGQIPDPYVGAGSLAAEWAEGRTWLYARSLAADPAWRGRRVRLRAEGVDYAARFVLNGVELGSHASSFTPAGFEVGELLRWGAPNELAVALAPAPREQGQMGRTSLVRTGKSRMGYWWDFCPRLVNLGLGGEVALDITGAVRIEDLWARPRLGPDFASAEVELRVALSSSRPVRALVEATVAFAGEELAAAREERGLPAGESDLTLRLPLGRPHLWWPNGRGGQPLYGASVRVTVADEPGAPSDERAASFGVRSVALAPNATPDPAAPPYTFVVNGERVYITGWNWVPLDALYGVPRPAKLDHLLELARRAHVNLLRVCGAGLIESRRFYERCDELGIMVWQDFTLSSSDLDRKPAEDPAYITQVVTEAREIVPTRRNHPSLVLWCAGNELESLEKLPLDDSEPVIGALRDVARELDPDRLWLPTSARGRKPFNGLSSIARDPGGLHDVHGPWMYEGLTEQYALYNAGTSLFHSEFGAEGLTNPEALRATIPPDELWPPTLESHAWRHLSAWWLRLGQWAEIFGPVGDIDTLARATQLLQAEGVRYAAESNRRRAPRNSGALPWQLNEPFPMAACTSAVDYFGRPKALYYAVARAYAPLAVSARYEALAWGGRERFAAELWAAGSPRDFLAGATLRWRVVCASGAEAAAGFVAAGLTAGGPARLGAVDLPLAAIPEDVFLLDIRLSDEHEQPAAQARYLFSRTASLAPLLALPAANLRAEAAADGDRWAVTVRNLGPAAALGVRLFDGRPVSSAGFALVADSHLHLLPGESRAVAVTWRGVPPAERLLTVDGLNAAPATLHLERTDP